MTAVDWSRPIEAVHEDGRVVTAAVDWKRSPDCDGDHWITVSGEIGMFVAGDDDRRISPICHGWRIRNVQPTTPERDPALWDRMVAVVRGFADSPGQDRWLIDARAIVADLPKPVDPDLIEARERAVDLLSKTVVSNGLPDQHPEIIRIREGTGDSNSYVVAILDAIRRGRQLAGEQA